MPSSASNISAHVSSLFEVIKNLPNVKEVIDILSTDTASLQTSYVKELSCEEHDSSQADTENTWKTLKKKRDHALVTLLGKFSISELDSSALLDQWDKLIDQIDLLQACTTPASPCFEQLRTQTPLASTRQNTALILQAFHLLIENIGMRSIKIKSIMQLCDKMLQFNQQATLEAAKALLSKDLITMVSTSLNSRNLFHTTSPSELALLEQLTEHFLIDQEDVIDQVIITYLQQDSKATSTQSLLEEFVRIKGYPEERGRAFIAQNQENKRLQNLLEPQSDTLGEFYKKLECFIQRELSIISAPSLFDFLQIQDTTKCINAAFDKWEKLFLNPTDDLRARIKQQTQAVQTVLPPQQPQADSLQAAGGAAGQAHTVKTALDTLTPLSKSTHNISSTIATTLLHLNQAAQDITAQELSEVLEKLPPNYELSDLAHLETINVRLKHLIPKILPMEMSPKEKSVIIFLHAHNAIIKKDGAHQLKLPTHLQEEKKFLKYASCQYLPIIELTLQEHSAKSKSALDIFRRSTGHGINSTHLDFSDSQVQTIKKKYHHPQAFSNSEILLSLVFLMATCPNYLTETDLSNNEHLSLEINMIGSCIALNGSIRSGSKSIEGKAADSAASLIQVLPNHYNFETGSLNLRGLAGEVLGEDMVKNTENVLLGQLPKAIHSFLILSFAAIIFLATSLPVFFILFETSIFTIAQSALLALLSGSGILITCYYLNKLLYYFSGAQSYVEDLRGMLPSNDLTSKVTATPNPQKSRFTNLSMGLPVHD
ncbi:MAG: hypothetical protein FJ186_01685 [Gammaproteobacteria bacterium]|nr:hypothetical protein [Gammaproteobacteria bacterium]